MEIKMLHLKIIPSFDTNAHTCVTTWINPWRNATISSYSYSHTTELSPLFFHLTKLASKTGTLPYSSFYPCSQHVGDAQEKWIELTFVTWSSLIYGKQLKCFSMEAVQWLLLLETEISWGLMTPMVTELTPGQSGSRACTLLKQSILSHCSPLTGLDPKWFFKAFGQTNSKTIYLEVTVQ